ncbi:MAG TPA: metalloregulator ArsR/SmtB family transcription factor [Pyrinomonadaceae bacterium]|nr:metalloregulator ArsR/SmtB family transcription factor [Pyrinomonadaceae bacterium]
MPSRGLETGGDLSRTLYERHAEMCKVFSNPTRLMILNVLRETEFTVAAIGEKLRIAPGTVSPHLLMMKRQRVLSSRKEGNQVFYRLVNPRMLKAFDLIRDVLYEQMNHEGTLTRHLKRERTRNRRRLQKVPAAYR